MIDFVFKFVSRILWRNLSLFVVLLLVEIKKISKAKSFRLITNFYIAYNLNKIIDVSIILNRGRQRLAQEAFLSWSIEIKIFKKNISNILLN